jgi:hypothetical protein
VPVNSVKAAELFEYNDLPVEGPMQMFNNAVAQYTSRLLLWLPVVLSSCRRFLGFRGGLQAASVGSYDCTAIQQSDGIGCILCKRAESAAAESTLALDCAHAAVRSLILTSWLDVHLTR